MSSASNFGVPRLGVITGGSLLEGLQAKLDPEVSVEDLRAGQYVVLEGGAHLFYTMITDVRLESASPAIPVRPPGDADDLLRAVLSGEWTYVTLHLRPLLQLPRSGEADVDNAQVKTVPPHFATARRADEADVARVFGEQGAKDRFHVGAPLDMDTPVCLNLSKFIERSNGIFGKTGTGKTFLTRLVLAGLLHKLPGEVVTLTFDMHNEYGNAARQEGSDRQVPGLKQLFGERVAIFTLDKESSQRRGAPYDDVVQLSYADLEPGDIYAMRDELGLSEAGCDTIGLAENRYGRDWLHALLHTDADALTEELGAHLAAVLAVRRKLNRLRGKDLARFLHEKLPSGAQGTMDKLLTRLTERRQHVVLEFGNVTSLLGYLLVANVLTRKLYAEWVRRSETYHASQSAADKPPHLVICVEEAHKFLNPEAARQTSFGQIARELRKYFVSLLIVDQRPSGIDDEILSQLGTRITAQLNDDRDIAAVLSGTPNAGGLRVVLAGLDSKQQALLFGHAVPMPVVLKTRTYDDDLYRAVTIADIRSTMGADPLLRADPLGRADPPGHAEPRGRVDPWG
jgi:DNA helicase HerA-like ATPase